MNPYAKQGSSEPANPYAKASAYKSTSVNTSSPADLVLMLYDGILRFLNNARGGFSIKDPVVYHQTIHWRPLVTTERVRGGIYWIPIIDIPR